MASHQRGKQRPGRLRPRGDFRLDADALRERFAFYTDAFDVPIRRPKGPAGEAAAERAHRQGRRGPAGRRPARRRHLHVEGHLQQLPRHHLRRRRADQHRHVLRGGGDQAAVRRGEQQPDPGDRVHPGPRRPRRRLVAVRRARRRDDRAGQPRRRPRVLARLQPFFTAAPGSCGAATSPTSTARTSRPSRWSPRPSSTPRVHLGGRRFELYSTPGGETTDSLVVWLPDERTVFTGNLTGPLFGHIPNLYTPRGDKYRSAIEYLHSVDRVIALEPETLITGHGEPIRGAEEIRRRLTQIRDATQYLRGPHHRGHERGHRPVDADGPDQLPPELDIPQGHGKVPWIVRPIWEEHAGWFRYESTTELYDVPPSASGPSWSSWPAAPPCSRNAPEPTSMPAGRCTRCTSSTSCSPRSRATRRAAGEARGARAAARASGRENFSEVRWLEAEIRDTTGVLT